MTKFKDMTINHQVLCPNWNVNDNRGYSLVSNLIQENFALIKRLVLQSYRRSSTLIVGIIQPLLWQSLFGAV